MAKIQITIFHHKTEGLLLMSSICLVILLKTIGSNKFVRSWIIRVDTCSIFALNLFRQLDALDIRLQTEQQKTPNKHSARNERQACSPKLKFKGLSLSLSLIRSGDDQVSIFHF